MLPKISIELENYLGSRNNCIVCGNKEFSSWATDGYLEALKCNNCGMISVNPHYTEKGLDYFYDNYFQNRIQNQKLKELRKEMYEIDKKWISKFVNKGKILDIGCGGGEFLGVFGDNWEKCGIDLAKDALDHAANTYDINTYIGKIGEKDVGNDYDLVMMRGVVEHFRDPIIALKKSAEILKSGGYLYITATPAGDSFAFYVYREKWRLFTPLEHIHFFTVELLSKVLIEFELEYIDSHYFYSETPYADTENDYKQMLDDIKAKGTMSEDVSESASFPGSMLIAVWQKT